MNKRAAFIISALVLFFVVCVIIAATGKPEEPDHPQTASQPLSGNSDPLQLTDKVGGTLRDLCLGNIIHNFQLIATPEIQLDEPGDPGEWNVVVSKSDCRSDEICMDVVYTMMNNQDQPAWHCRFDAASRAIDRISDIDADTNHKYFMIKPSSRGGGDTGP